MYNQPEAIINHKSNLKIIPLHSKVIKFAPSVYKSDIQLNRFINLTSENYLGTSEKREILETDSKYLQELMIRKREISNKLNQIKKTKNTETEKLRNYEFLNYKSEKHIYKMPLHKISLPINKKKILSPSEQIEPNKYNRINIDQDDYLKITQFKNDRHAMKINSKFFNALNHNNKEKKPISFPNYKKDNIVNFLSELNSFSQITESNENTKRNNKLSPTFANRHNLIKKNQVKIFRDQNNFSSKF